MEKPRLRLIQGGLSLRPAALQSDNIDADLRRRHAQAASRWVREGTPPPRGSHLVVI